MKLQAIITEIFTALKTVSYQKKMPFIRPFTGSAFSVKPVLSNADEN
jgi:hypothetical protein